LAEIKIDKSKKCAQLKIDEINDDLMISIENGEPKIYKKILKKSENISLRLDDTDDTVKPRYRSFLLFSKSGKKVYISDYFGNLIIWDWIKEPKFFEKKSSWYSYREGGKTMFKSKYINQSLFNCYQMNLRNASGIPEEKIMELIKLGAVI